MARSRTFKSNLARLLSESNSPIYVVAEDGSIEYANEACLAWVGLSEEQLRGVQCQSSPLPLDDPIQNQLRGLMPSEETFQRGTFEDGEFLSFAAFVAKDDSLRWRNGTIQRVSQGGQIIPPLLIVLEEQDSAERPQPKPDELMATGTALRQSLAEICTQQHVDFEFASLIGTTSGARQLSNRIVVAAECNASLFIHGPEGSGREHLARSLFTERIRRCSNANQPGQSGTPPDRRMVPLHCEIADQQLVQENIREVFSDAFGGLRSGNNESESDCLLLLNVDKLSQPAQSELQGFLELPGFLIETICTSSRSPRELVEGGFLKPLAELICTLEIELPPLKKRAADIPLLANAVLSRDNRRRGRRKSGFTTQAMQALIEYDWPGNIAELEQVVMSASDRATSTLVNSEDLPLNFHQSLSAQRIGQPVETSIDLDAYLQTIERELIDRALNRAGGVKSRAAKLLGISRAKLIRRLTQLGLTGQDRKPEQDPAELDSSVFEETDE